MPAPAPSARAEWLKQRELSVFSSDATITTRWGEDAGDTSQSSLLVAESAASAEAGRQLALMASPRALDAVTLSEVNFDLEGETIDIDYAGELGMAGMARLLVLVAKPDLNANTTEVVGLVTF